MMDITTLTTAQLGDLASCGPFLGPSTERTLRALGIEGIEPWVQAQEIYMRAMRALNEQFTREPEVADADFLFAPDSDALRALKVAAGEARDVVEAAWTEFAPLIEAASQRYYEITGGL